MTTAIHRTTYQYYTGVPSNLDTETWLLNPSLTAVSGVPQKYWKVSGNSVIEMTAGEKTLKEQLLAAQAMASNAYDKVINIKPDQDHFSRIYIFSCDFAKKETWYLDSVWTTDSFPANGVQKTFSLTEGSGNNTAVIDMSHNKITDEYNIVSPSGASYVPVVTINGAPQTEREAYESSGGQFEIDYTAGEITFFAAPPSGNTVKVDYWYSPANSGPIILGGPPPGKKWVINSAEVQFSSDIQMNDALVQNVIADIPIFDASGVLQTVLYDTKVQPDTVYGTMGNILDYTYGSHPMFPACGGSPRGLLKDTIVLRWDYPAAIELKSSINMRLKVWTKHGRGYGGERATVTIYGVQADE